MNDTTTMSAPAPDPLVDELYSLTERRARIDQEIAVLLQRVSTGNGGRPWWHCFRCGYDWRGYATGHPPKHCARCHSAAWMATSANPESYRERQPVDPPRPNWRQRKRERAREERWQPGDTSVLSIAITPPSMLPPPPPPVQPERAFTPPPAVPVTYHPRETEPQPERSAAPSVIPVEEEVMPLAHDYTMAGAYVPPMPAPEFAVAAIRGEQGDSDYDIG